MSFAETHAQPAKNLPMRGNVTSGMDRIMNMPRVYMWNNIGVVGHGPGAGTMAFDQIRYDTDGMASASAVAATARIICRTAGVYFCTAGALLATGTGARQTYILKNGTDVYGQVFTGTTTGGVMHCCSAPIPMNALDYLQLVVNAVTNATDITLGIANLYITACLISTL